MAAVPPPLRIKPLRHQDQSRRPEHGSGGSKHETVNDSVGHYEVLHRKITPSPLQRRNKIHGTACSAEIETRLEQFVGKNDGTILWRRVVVSSGPCSTACAPSPNSNTIHASFLLPEDDATQGVSAPPGFYLNPDLLCWTSFCDRPDHTVLCVLAHPSLLCIWDVYPMPVASNDDVSASHSGARSGSMGHGHHIPLPFDARGIFGVACAKGVGGLLLQRCETAEDFFVHGVRTDRNTAMADKYNSRSADEITDDGFVLQPPPEPVRLGGHDATANYRSTNAACSSGENEMDCGVTSVPSLFTLSHPLGDILPVTLSERNKKDQDQDAFPACGAVADVFEKVLFVGTAEWMDANDESPCDRRMQSRIIYVTYHTLLKRHAVWEIRETPSPSPPDPLWKLCPQWRSKSSLRSGHLGVVQQDAEFIGGAKETSATSSSRYESRADALADALGVLPRRATPRNAAVGLTNSANWRVSRSGRGTAAGSKASAKAPIVNNSFLSPMSKASTVINSGGSMNLSSTAQSTAARFDDSLMTKFDSFAAKLQPNVSMSCIYCDPSPTQAAENVFLASNTSGAGKLVLCLVSPVVRSVNESDTNPKELRLFSLSGESTAGAVDVCRQRCRLSVTYNGSIPCMAAQPINATPIPKMFTAQAYLKPNAWAGMAKDILILKRSEQRAPSLCLYRNAHPIAECAFERSRYSNDGVEMFDLRHGVGNAVDIHYRTHAQRHSCVVRARLTLVHESSVIGEKVMQAAETALAKVSLVDVALKIRADCVEMERELAKISLSDVTSDAACNEAVKIVMLSLFRSELLSSAGSASGRTKNVSIPASIGCENWKQISNHNDGDFIGDFQDFSRTSLHFSAQNSMNATSHAAVPIGKILSIPQLGSLGISVSEVLFDAMHMLYEDLKLHSSMTEVGVNWARSVLSEASAVALRNSTISADVPRKYLSHYAMNLCSLQVHHKDSSEAAVITAKRTDSSRRPCLTSLLEPPCLFSWIEQGIAGERVSGRYAGGFDATRINAVCDKTNLVVRVFSFLSSCTDSSLQNAEYEIPKLLVQEGFTSTADFIDEFPAGLALPLLAILYRCRSMQTGHSINDDSCVWPLIGRNDIFSTLNGSQSAVQRFLRISDKENAHDSKSGGEVAGMPDDGVAQLEFSSSMLFPQDNRIREVCRLLRSSRPIYLKVPRAIEFTDHDYERKKQEKLLLLSRRVLALPIGRGMFTVGHMRPIPSEPIPLPGICLAGRVPPTNATLALDASECPADMKLWPDFHNGVAAGLRLPLRSEQRGDLSNITRTWIVYNRSPSNSGEASSGDNTESGQQSLSHCHGGFLMALGMRGYLRVLEMTDIFDYLTHGSITTTVGTLLGMAANMRGTCDISVSKMLCLHIPSLIPQHFSTIDVASAVQAAAVTGAGILYEGSCHRMMTEFLLDEIGKRPFADGNVVDREAYSLACGVALGMVNLCKGDRSRKCRAGLADLHIEERLYRYIVGGPVDSAMHGHRSETERTNFPSSQSVGNNERCSCIFEGETINIDVTSPGATLALGLMYMKSGNRTIASAISIPDTHFLLEYIRPDFLMLRIISRALILWDDVYPTNEWIDSQLPKVIVEAYNDMRHRAERSQTSLKGPTPRDLEYDRQAVRLIYAHLIAGACFAIGLRFAGTADMNAASSIFDRLFELRELRDGGSTAASALRPPLSVLDMCLGCAAISLSMVLAGTGDLDAFRLIKILRWPCTDDTTYGSHLAYASAIGLLFLGGGTCTLGRDPKDIACLLVSFYPRYPQSTSDNQYHLQALRNLYALATKRREIRAVDVDTGERVFVPVEIHFENDSTMPMQLSTPCLLLNTDENPKELRVVSRNYFPLSVALHGQGNEMVFFVKRKSAYSLCHEKGRDSEMLRRPRDFGMECSLSRGSLLTANPCILHFAKHLCEVKESERKEDLYDQWSLSNFCIRALHESFLRDTQEAFSLFVALWNCISSIRAGSSSSSASWNFRLMNAFYQRQNAADRTENSYLLNPELFAFFVQGMEIAFEHVPFAVHHMRPFIRLQAKEAGHEETME